MSMTDPIADMLTRIRNACGSKHRRVDMPASKMKTEIARILKANNFIQDYRHVENDAGHKLLRVILKLRRRAAGDPQLQRVSTPGLRKYVAVSEIPRVRNGLGHGDPEHVAGADVRRGGAPGAHRRRAARPRLVRRSHDVANWQASGHRACGRDGDVEGNDAVGEGAQGRAHPHAAPGDDPGVRQQHAHRHAPDRGDSAQGAARPDAHAGGQHGRGRDQGLHAASSRSAASATRPRSSRTACSCRSASRTRSSTRHRRA